MLDSTPFTGEPLALDLVNTRPFSSSGPVDLIDTLQGLRAWLTLEAERLRGFPVKDVMELTGADLAPVLAVRDHMTAAVEHVRRGLPPPAATLEGLNAAMHAAPAMRELRLQDGVTGSVELRRGPPGPRLAACLSDAAADFLCDPAVRLVRQCAAKDCTMLFVATNPRRRWCSSARCGNRARVARYYHRRKWNTGTG